VSRGDHKTLTKSLAAEAAKRARFRVHHVGTKLNEAELRELEALAAKRKETQAELIRGLILHELARDAEGLRPSWFRQLDLAPFDGLIWPHLKACDLSFRVGLGGRSP
jgi:hypothetical protein